MSPVAPPRGRSSRLRASAIAIGAVSPLGSGEAAFDVTGLGLPAMVAVRRDSELERLGFARPFAARAPDAAFEGTDPSADRAVRLLDRATDLVLASLSHVRTTLANDRVALVLGTSSGGMCTAEALFRRRAHSEEVPKDISRGATYFAPFTRCRERIERAGLSVVCSMQVVTACAASTWALGVGLRWLESDAADVVLAGGYDALCTFVASGFESLRATSASMPAPFRVGRDGMALGEGAGLVALVREGEERGAPVRFFVGGFGASTDAVHITAPDRTGGGIARAARAALADAALDASACALVSAHCTSTPYNDAMESKAIRDVFGADAPIVHPFKAQIGHTLGAAGVLETLALARAVEAQVAPAAAGTGELNPDASVRMLEVAQPVSCQAALKLSAAFGGANAALVVERMGTSGREPPRLQRAAYIKAFATADAPDVEAVAQASGTPSDKVARLDALSLLLATAVAKLGRERIAGGGILVGHALATLDINERFFSRVLAKGPTAAEPRLFPPTSPNLMPGQVAILFGLTGPSAALASGPLGALNPLRLAIDLVRVGDAERIVVAAVDDVGPASKFVLAEAFPEQTDIVTGAVAALIDADPQDAIADLSEAVVPCGFGHKSLEAELRRRIERNR